MLIHKLTIFVAILLLSTCTSPTPTQTGSDISTNAPKEIGWETAKQLVFAGDVETIVQSHDLNVILQLKDGTQFITTEPELDSIVQILKECGVRCSTVSMMTE